ncbi:DUF4258 domain-containing protein [Bradyrhizobium sp.]|uniref:DUF4258 domain-containing protein n=1 Tax=Bradyrhizobium sp. TaxID=376 RepID=UPI003C73B1DA
MSQVLVIVRELLRRGEYLVSRHGYRELAADDILLDEVLAGIESAVVVEDYPDSRKEPAVLVLQRDRSGLPVHVMWGVPKINGTPAVLVTAYRPASERWSADFMKRKNPE